MFSSATLSRREGREERDDQKRAVHFAGLLKGANKGQYPHRAPSQTAQTMRAVLGKNKSILESKQHLCDEEKNHHLKCVNASSEESDLPGSSNELSLLCLEEEGRKKERNLFS